MRLLRRRDPEALVVDPDLASDTAFVQWLAFGMVFGDDRARDAVADAVQHRNEWESTEGRLLTTDARLRALPSLHEEVVLNALQALDPRRPTAMGVTGGYDSRAVAAVADARLDHVTMYTYGREGSIDFDVIAHVEPARRLGVRMIDTTLLEWDRPTLIASVRATQDRVINPRMVVAPSLDRELGPRFEVHGYLNDMLTGGTGPKTPSASWHEARAVWSADNNPFGFQEHLPPGTALSLLSGVPLSDHLDFDRQLKIGYRSAQRTRPVSTTSRTYVLPFEDPRWIGFWLTFPWEELRSRSLWIRYLTERRFPWFPELAGRTDPSVPYRQTRDAWLTQVRPARTPAESRAEPIQRSAEMCWLAAHRDSPAFRGFVDDSIERLRRRRVFRDSFVTAAMRGFLHGSAAGRRAVRGLVSTEVNLAAGVFGS